MSEEMDALRKKVSEILQPALARRQRVRSKMQEIDEAVKRTRTDPRHPGDSDVCIPIIRSQRKQVRSRLFQGLLGQTPVCRIRPVSSGEPGGPDMNEAAVAATDYFEFAYKRRDELNVSDVMRKFISEFVDYGRGWLKVVPLFGDRRGYVGPRWFFVSHGDMLFPEGMGDDVNEIPYIGQVYTMSADEALLRKDFDREAVKLVTQAPDDDVTSDASEFADAEIGVADPVENDRNKYAELWFRWKGQEVIVDVHLATMRVMGRPRPNRLGKRPFFTAVFEEVSPTSLLGRGLPEELGPLQDICNALYNGAVDSVVVALHHVKLIRHGSMLQHIVGEGDEDDKLEIMPNMTIPTENPEADMVVRPLGDPSSAGAALRMAETFQAAAATMEGIGAAQMGNVGVTQRAPASGVASVLAEGSFPIRDASQRLAEAFREAVLTTFDFYARFAPAGRPYQVLGDAGVIVQQVFKLQKKTSEVFNIEVDVADPTRSDEATRQRALLRAQFVMTAYEKIVNYLPVIVNPQAPPALRDAFKEVAGKIVTLIRYYLETDPDVKTVKDLLIDVDLLVDSASQAAEQQQQQQAAMQQQAAQQQQQQQPMNPQQAAMQAAMQQQDQMQRQAAMQQAEPQAMPVGFGE